MNTQKVRDILCRNWRTRTFTLLALAALCVWTGLTFGRAMKGWFGEQEAFAVFKTVTVAAVVFGVWKILADNWFGLWKFLKLDDRSQLLRPMGQLAIAVTGFGLVVGGSGAATAGGERTATMLVTSSIVLTADDGPQTMDTARIMLPYFSSDVKDPGGDGDPTEKLEKECDANLKTLATVDAEGIAAIRTLACGLRSCSSPEKPVVIDVQGFASSRSFLCGGKSSNVRNLALAEQRRRNVIGLLDASLQDSTTCTTLGKEGRLSYEPAAPGTRWVNHLEMEQRRDLVDVSPAAATLPDRSREILSRRVDILVKERGECAVDQSRPVAGKVAPST